MDKNREGLKQEELNYLNSADIILFWAVLIILTVKLHLYGAYFMYKISIQIYII